ncbi:MAG: hypothetical protein ACK4LB_03795 [Spirosomataceae bacterium]
MKSPKNNEKLWVYSKLLFQGFMGIFYTLVGLSSFSKLESFFGLPAPYRYILGGLFIVYGLYRTYRIYQDYQESK